MTGTQASSVNEGGISAISGSSNLVSLRGRYLHFAGSYESDGIWIGAYVDDEDLRRLRLDSRQDSSAR